MSKEINKTVIAGVILLIIMIVFSSCTSNQKESSTVAAATSITPLQSYEYKQEDTDDTWKDENVTATISLADADTKVSGSGASYSDNTLTISSAGTYLVSGSLSNGQILIDTADTQSVRLILNGVNIKNKTAPAIYEKNAEKTIVTLVKDSKNTLTDSESYKATGTSDPNAAFFATHDLSINGEGELVVNGKYNNGIGTQDDLCIVSSKITVNAVNNSIKGRDLIALKDVTIDVVSKNDGLKANNDTDKNKGFVQVDSGTINISANNDGIQAETNVIINGGNISITTTGQNTDGTESMKGIKAISQVAIKGGTLTFNCTDDAVHSNGNVTIDGGSLTIATKDDGIHADNAAVINDGTINITESYEGIEGATVEINHGNIDITASDDGINAAGGTDDTTSDSALDTSEGAVAKPSGGAIEKSSDGAVDPKQGPMGKDEFAANENNHIKINGGNLVVNAQGDGLDSNGDLYIEGGTVNISGPSSGAESALDTNGEIFFNGGLITASGNTSMAESPSDESKQNSITMVSTTNQSKGTTLYLLDSSGNIIAEHTPKNDGQIIMFSSKDIKEGETYSVSSGTTDKKLFDITVSQTNTVVDETGQATQLKGMGGAPGEGNRNGGNPSGGGGNPPNGGTPPSGDPPEDVKKP